MYESFGLVAGRGQTPFMFLQEARKHGVKKLYVAAMNGETDPEIEKVADHVEWFYVGQIKKAINFFKNNNVQNMIFTGQVKPERLFTGFRPDLLAVKIMATTKEKNAESLFGAVANEFEKAGVHVCDASIFMEKHMSHVGQMGKVKVKKDLQNEIDFGVQIARETSRLDIGQTVVVKKGTVLAVEAFEGTDKAVLRGGELGHGDVTVVKISKPKQDMRCDIPCIGMQTVENLIEAKAHCLAVHAERTLFIEKEKVIDALNKAGIALFGFTTED